MRRTIVFNFLLITSFYLHGQTDSSKYDPFLLKEVVITDFDLDKKLNVPVSLTTIAQPADAHLQGVAATLSHIPGIFADASTGEAFSRIYTRGISLSAEDDIGWYYMSLQEDGLPITAVQYAQFSPDFFFRPDVSHSRLEVINGGKSSVLAPSSPAGIVNFISESTPSNYATHDRLTTGLYPGGRPYIRVEGFSGGPLGNSGWGYDFAYLYRYDQGPRKLDYSMNNGGQIKLGLQKALSNGLFSMKLKWLDDKVNRYTGVAATNWRDPEPAFGQSFQQTSLLPPALDGELPDPRNNQNLEYNPANGIQAGELSALIALDLQLGEWRLTNKLKYSAKSLNWQTAIGGQPLGLENFISYFISGDPFPIGIVNFSEVSSGQNIASVNNTGAFAIFQGQPPSFEYTSGALPNDAIMGSGTWYKDDQINDLMNQLLLHRQFENINLNTGIFYARTNVSIFTNASFIYSTYEPESRLLQVSLDDFDGNRRQLSDANGLSNYGGLFYEGADITANQLGIFGDADFLLTEDLSFNAGIRFERIAHNGTRDRTAPLPGQEGGIDGNPITTYDGGLLGKAGDDEISASYNYGSYSLALDFKANESTSLFTRYSLGHKAPELNYYIDNFSNQDIPMQEPPVQSVKQVEFGIKKSGIASSIMATAFLSELDNVAYSNFVFDDQENRIFYTPTQFNSSRTIGLELALAQLITNRLSFQSSITLQNPKLSSFTLYDAAGTIDTGDDEIADFSDNILPYNPKLMFNAGLSFEEEDWFIGGRINYVGSRYGNLENAFELPAYQTVDIDLGYALSSKFSLGFRIKNLFNSAGLTNFFGPNQFGSNSDAASKEFIANNPGASFVVFPIMARAIYLSVDYTFSK